tara:strand:- start:97 stop:204 length:108 start_codon:yes stop_codon:yes gene_type:complete
MEKEYSIEYTRNKNKNTQNKSWNAEKQLKKIDKLV